MPGSPQTRRAALWTVLSPLLLLAELNGCRLPTSVLGLYYGLILGES